MHSLTPILKSFLTVAIVAMVIVAQFACPVASECKAEAVGVMATADSDKDASASAPHAVVMQAGDIQAIVPFVKLQLQTAYFLVRQMSATVVDTAPIPLPLPQYKDVWFDVVFCTAISPQAP